MVRLWVVPSKVRKLESKGTEPRGELYWVVSHMESYYRRGNAYVFKRMSEEQALVEDFRLHK